MILESYIDSNLKYNMTLIENYTNNLNEEFDYKSKINKIKEAIKNAISIIVEKIKDLIKWFKYKLKKSDKKEKLSGIIIDYEYTTDALKNIDAILHVDRLNGKIYSKIITMINNKAPEDEIEDYVSIYKDDIDEVISNNLVIVKGDEQVQIDVGEKSDFYIQLKERYKKLDNVIKHLNSLNENIKNLNSIDQNIDKYQIELINYTLKLNSAIVDIFSRIKNTFEKIENNNTQN